MGNLVRSLVGVALAATLVSPAFAADLATPTATVAAATPVATPAADTGQDRTRQRPSTGGEVLEKPVTFEGGAQIGSSTSGASLVTWMARGTCTPNLPAITSVPTPIVGPPRVVKVNCTITGAAVGDSIFVALTNWSEGEYAGLRLDSARIVAANTAELVFTHGSLAGLDPGPLTVNYLVVR